MTIIERFRGWYVSEGLTRTEAARRIGWSHAGLAMAERKGSLPNFERVEAMAAAMGIEFEAWRRAVNDELWAKWRDGRCGGRP